MVQLPDHRHHQEDASLNLLKHELGYERSLNDSTTKILQEVSRLSELSNLLGAQDRDDLARSTSEVMVELRSSRQQVAALNQVLASAQLCLGQLQAVIRIKSKETTRLKAKQKIPIAAPSLSARKRPLKSTVSETRTSLLQKERRQLKKTSKHPLVGNSENSYITQPDANADGFHDEAQQNEINSPGYLRESSDLLESIQSPTTKDVPLPSGTGVRKLASLPINGRPGRARDLDNLPGSSNMNKDVALTSHSKLLLPTTIATPRGPRLPQAHRYVAARPGAKSLFSVTPFLGRSHTDGMLRKAPVTSDSSDASPVFKAPSSRVKR